MDHQGLPPVDLPIAAEADEVVADLLEAVGPGRNAPWHEPVLPKRKEAGDGSAVTLPKVATALRKAVADPDKVSFASLCRGWPTDIWPLRDPLAYLGKDGGGGIGSGPGISVGVALALHTRGRQTVTVLGDGDFAMGGNALWSAVRHRIPILFLVNNNRSYFNDELHQETVAKRRGREAANRWVGQRLSDPDVNFAKLAEAQGAVGIGPVRSSGEIAAAIEKGVGVLNSGGVAVVDFHITPGEERHAQAALGVRKTDK
jgi:thiamine pyrophosphate-dependent acetolactate synthase large subunit-like protein